MKSFSRKMKLLLTTLFREYRQNELGLLSVQTAYFLLLSFIPFLIFLLTLIGSLQLPAQELYNYLKNILPEQTYLIVSKVLLEILETRSVNIMSLLFTLIFSTKGVRAIIKAINKAYCIQENRSIYRLWLLSFVFTMVLAFILILSLVTIVFGKSIGQIAFSYLNLQNEFLRLWEYFRYGISVLSLVMVFSFIYKYAPCCNRKLKITNVIVGSVFTTLCWTITSSLFSYYINHFNRSYMTLYGSLGGIFSLLIWLYMSSQIILIGGVINGYLFKNANIKT